MMARFIITDYVNQAVTHATCDKLDDGIFAGRIPYCLGMIAFDPTLSECEAELRSTLEDCILVGPKFSHSLPVIGGIDLNKEPQCEPVEAVKAHLPCCWGSITAVYPVVKNCYN